MMFRIQLLLLLLGSITVLAEINSTTNCEVVEHDHHMRATCSNVEHFNLIENYENITEVVITDCFDVQHLGRADDKWFMRVTDVTLLCPLTVFPYYTFWYFRRVQHVLLPQCMIKRLYWQQVLVKRVSDINLRRCPIPCDCNHAWLEPKGAFPYITRPRNFYSNCEVAHCRQGTAKTDKKLIKAKAGDNITITVTVNDTLIEGGQHDFQYFKLPQYADHPHEEIIDNNTMILTLRNVTIRDVGDIIFTCWKCHSYVSSRMRIVMDLKLRLQFRNNTSEHEDILEATGYPLFNMTFNLTHVSTNRSEIYPMNGKPIVFFDSILIENLESQYFFQDIFRISLYDKAKGDHVTGLVRFRVCAGNNTCRQRDRELWYLGRPRSTTTLPPSTTSSLLDSESAFGKFGKYSIFFICAILIIAIVYATFSYYRLKLRQYVYRKFNNLRRRNPSSSNGSNESEMAVLRRQSGGTKESFISTPEQASIASDYTNQIIEFIEIGAIKIHEVIGKGAFGRVYSGTWEKKGEVAIKTINQVGDAIEKEAVLLSHLEHPNIVQLYGMTRKDGNLLLVFELMNLGDLRKYLKDRKPANAGSYSQFPPPLTTMELKKIIVDILKGLSYLQKQPVVHRDLAARNCLVAGDTDVRSMSAAQRPPTVVKIADFGMSKLLKGKEYYLVEREGLLPIRWMPPESVNDFRFTIMSDIWSLGVTMWEVMNYGDLPFGEDIPSALAINYAVHGMPPPKTSYLSDELYALMRRCWELVPEERIPVDDILLDPQFETIVSSRPAETVSISTDPLLPLDSDE